MTHSGERGTPTCYAQTHLRGPGYMAVCGQVSNIVATDDPADVTCQLCTPCAGGADSCDDSLRYVCTAHYGSSGAS